MAPADITPEQVEALRKEFAKLQDQLSSLEFPRSAAAGLQKFNDALKESYRSIDKQQQAIADLNKQYTRQQDELTRIASAHGTASDEYARAEAAYIDTQAARTAANDNLTDSFAKLNDRLADNVDQLKKAGDAQQLYTEALAHLEEAQNGATEAIRAAAYDEYIKKLREAGEELDEFTEKVEFGEETFDGLAQSMFGLSGPFKTFTDLAASGEGGLQGFATSAMESVKSGKLLGQALLKLVKVSFDFAVEQDKIFSEFRKSTGAGKEFNDVIKDIEGSGRIAGVTLEESMEAVKALRDSFTDFAYMNQEQQKELGKTVSILGEMGFSMQTQASIIQTTTKAMGMSVEGATNTLVELTNTARSLGTDVETMGKEFEANKDILVRFGTASTKVFKEMAVQAKATGMEVSTLLGLVDKFKTFDEAGRAVGRLNAILGGPFLNSLDMLNAAYDDPLEGIKMLKGAFDEAGVSAESLSGAELMAFSDALGMSAEETAKLLSKSNAELEIERMTMAELAEEAAEMQTMTDKLANAFKQLYLDAEPFVSNVLVPMIDGFAKFMGWIGEGIRSLGTFGSTALFVGTAIAGLMIATGVGSPWGIAALAVLGGAAMGGLAVAGEAPEAKEVDTTGFAAGGRVLQSHRSRKLRGFAPGGRVGQDDLDAAYADPASAPIRMNEGNRKELAIVPIGTYVARADQLQQGIHSTEDMADELRGLRKDMITMLSPSLSPKKVQLVLDNGKEFSTTVVKEGLANGSAVTPFGGGGF